ncbi:hypothetical protein [Seleniivibrio woodruffii]|uniref:hypothetical protein n=1 Tax=Seleniivibrio woodruffii TaxID=1078050 RepID=UPI0026EBCC02|nr:hypothetical protein [Seleniivibrio woodruffii]
MKTIIFTILISCASFAFAMGDRSTLSSFEKVNGFAPVSKPAYGVRIFNSEDEYSAFHRARAVMNKNTQPFDYANFSLLVAYFGKEAGGSCIEVYRIDETEKSIVVYAEPVKCSKEWYAPYVYYKIKKTVKPAKIIVK